MSSDTEYKIPPAVQPRPEDYDYDLDRALSAVVGLRAMVPEDAFTAGMLGTERAGNGVVIGKDGLVLTIGYLVTEAETIWLSLNDGKVVPGHALAYDPITGFGLVQALGRLDVPPLPLGRSEAVAVGESVVVGGAGGRRRSVAARIVGRQEFAGYWEYVLEDALFTAPAHPHWGGTAVIGPGGDLLGIGSLQLEQSAEKGGSEQLNMIVPIDLLKPVLDDLVSIGRQNRPPRPWLGLFATEAEGKVVVVGIADEGPAEHADIKVGDIVLAVAGQPVEDLAGFFRSVWALGDAGVEVPLAVFRDGEVHELRVESGDRSRLFRATPLH
jgi:S1-C subfamily serine protease